MEIGVDLVPSLGVGPLYHEFDVPVELVRTAVCALGNLPEPRRNNTALTKDNHLVALQRPISLIWVVVMLNSVSENIMARKAD
jgi:hypothetical protein